MTQKEKELLLRDLCARLPYRPKCEMIDGLRVVNNEKDPSYISTLFPKHIELFFYHNNFTIKPYLRHMSSMTEEEKKEFNSIMTGVEERCINAYGKGGYTLAFIEINDWLNKHHFDYRGLIGRNIAHEAPEGMYNSKQE